MAKVMELQHSEQLLRSELDATKKDLADTRAKAQQYKEAKDEEISLLKRKLSSLESSYEVVLNDALDSLVEKMGSSKAKWASEADKIQTQSEKMYQSYGMSRD